MKERIKGIVNRKVSIAGRGIPIVAILLALLITGASAVLVTQWYSQTVNLDVTQSLTYDFDGRILNISIIAGETYSNGITVSNIANVPVTVEIYTIPSDEIGFTFTYASNVSSGNPIDETTDIDNDGKIEVVIPANAVIYDTRVYIHTDPNLASGMYSFDTLVVPFTDDSV